MPYEVGDNTQKVSDIAPPENGQEHNRQPTNASDTTNNNDNNNNNDKNKNKNNNDSNMSERNDNSTSTGNQGEVKKKYDPKDPLRPRRKKARRACYACQRAHLTCGKLLPLPCIAYCLCPTLVLPPS